MAKVTYVGTAASYVVQGVTFRPRKPQFVTAELGRYLEPNEEQFIVDMKGTPDEEASVEELEAGVREASDPEIPTYPSNGFDSKDAVIAWVKATLDIDLSGEKNRALKTLNNMAAEAYRLRYFPDEAPDGEDDDSVTV